MNEAYRGLTGEAMKRCSVDGDRRPMCDLGRARRLFRRRDARIELCFLEMRTGPIPTRKETEFAAGLAHAHSDIVPLPMRSNFVDRVTDVSVEGRRTVRTLNDAMFERVMGYLRDSIDAMMRLGSKPVMGYIPNYRLYFEEIVGMYVDRGINAFYFDARAATPVALQAPLGALRRELDGGMRSRAAWST